MNTTQPKPDCGATQPVRTTLQLGAHDMLSVQLRAGDQLRGERGTVWITEDGRLDDILLAPGDCHRVAQDGALNVSALRGGSEWVPGSACVSVAGRAPLTWQHITARRPRFYNRASAGFAAGR